LQDRQVFFHVIERSFVLYKNREVPFSANAGDLNGVVASDLNGDGLTDFAVASGSANTVSIHYGNANGTFSSPVLLNASAGTNAIALGNFLGTNTVGIAVTNTSAPSVSVFEATFAATATATGVAIPGTDTHQIYASYAGDSNYAASQSTSIGLAAQRISTSLSVAANPASTSSGQQTTLTAILTPYTDGTLSTNGDSVTFYNGTTALGTGSLTSGVATLNVNPSPTGSDSITASYAGDSNFVASTASAITVIVSAAATPLASVSPNSLTFAGVSVGSTSTAQTVTLSNYGTGALSISSIAASGDFPESNACGPSLFHLLDGFENSVLLQEVPAPLPVVGETLPHHRVQLHPVEDVKEVIRVAAHQGSGQHDQSLRCASQHAKPVALRSVAGRLVQFVGNSKVEPSAHVPPDVLDCRRRSHRDQVQKHWAGALRPETA
jgi:hypothetical protein